MTPPLTRAKMRADAWEIDTLIFSDVSALAQASQQPTKALGIQIVGNDYAYGAWFGENGYAQIIRDWNPAFVNLIGAGQYNEARQRSQWLKDNLPHIKRIWRHMIHVPPGGDHPTDDGLWHLPADQFRDNIILAHGYHETGDYIVTDNEASMEDYTPYAAHQAEVIRLCVPTGARLAVLRTPTHWPTPEQISMGQLDELFQAVADHMGDFDDPKVILSPNAYFDDWNVDGLARIHLIEQRFVYVTGRYPVICLGEYGFDKNFSSGNGWRSTHMGFDVYSNMLVQRYQDHLWQWAACVYCAGVGDDDKVAKFTIDRADLPTLGQKSPVYDSDHPDEIPPPEGEMSRNEQTWYRVKLHSDLPVRVRAAPNTDSSTPILSNIQPGAELDYLTSPTQAHDGFVWHQVHTLKDVFGWMALIGGQTADQQFTDARAIEPPEPPQEPEPPTGEYVTRAEMDAAIALLRNEMLTLLNDLVAASGEAHLKFIDILKAAQEPKEKVA